MADMKVKNRLVVEASEALVNGQQVTTTANTQTLTNKSISGSTNTLSDIPNSALSAGIDASKIADGSVSNAEFQSLDGVTSSIQTQLNDRALDSAVIKKDGSVAFTAAQSMGGFKLTSLANGTASSDAVNKGQMDAALEGLKPKAAVRVATTANILISTALNAGDVIDGVTLADGDRVLVKNQTSAEENGIYIAGATPARSSDFDSLSPIDEINGSLVAVQEGTANAGKVFVQSGVVVVLDTDPINFVFFNSSASLVGGDGITVSGSNISVDHDGEGLTFVATQLALELDGSTLSKSGSGVKVADGGITNTQVASGIDATKIGNGDVDNTELSYLNGVTSSLQTQINGKLSLTGGTMTGVIEMSNNKITGLASPTLSTDAARKDYVDNQLISKADRTLANLTTTSINANLLPSGAGARNLGSSALPWGDTVTNNISSTQISMVNSIGGSGRGIIDATTARTLSSGDISEFTIYSPNNSGVDFGIQAGDPALGPTGSVFVTTGNASVNNNSGAIKLYTGTVSGSGVRGDVSLDARSVIVRSGSEIRYNNPANTFYTSLKAGTNLANLSLTLPIADGTSGQVLQTDGFGVLSFVTAAAGYTDEQAQDAVGTILVDSATIDFTYDDGTPSITASVIDASITNAKIATGVDAAKIADGSVSNAEFQYLDGVTSSIQTQLNGKVTAVTGDIAPASFSFANNQASLANVTGLAFANATTRSFKALVDVQLDATVDAYEAYELLAVQKGASWDMSVNSVGDSSGVTFDITNAGQVQYTSANAAGFVSGTMKFRASTIPVA
jgi:hypothetical protein